MVNFNVNFPTAYDFARRYIYKSYKYMFNLRYILQILTIGVGDMIGDEEMLTDKRNEYTLVCISYEGG